MIRIHCEHHPGHEGLLDPPKHPSYSGKRQNADPRYTKCADCRRWFLPGEITLNGGRKHA